MKKWLLSLLMYPATISAQHNQPYAIVGTYTGGKSEGIYVYRFNSNNGTASEVSHVKTPNPSYLVVSPDERYVYAVLENARNGNGGSIAAFSFDKESGTLTKLNEQLTGGDHPCYVEIDKTGKWVFAGNYSSGSLSVLPVKEDGSLGQASSHLQHTGSGKDMKRQDKPHVHCTVISPDNKWLYVPDLGIDKVMIYSFDATTGKLGTADPAFAAAEPGDGPRHITFHPSGKYAYLITELTGAVIAYQFENGKLKQLQRISTIPAGQKGYAGSADIHVSADGKFLYASNRGDFNNIAIYAIDEKTGQLTLRGIESARGKSPRNFNFDPTGEYLLVAKQYSDESVVLKRNTSTGLLTDSGNRISTGKPVCIKWINP